ncbi:hypothetical protein F5879DRAFT_765691, partial [Lentinula edodes]
SLISGWEAGEREKWIAAYSKDPHFVEVIRGRQSEKDMNHPVFPQYYIGEEGLVYFEDNLGNMRLCVPKDLQAEIMNEIHNTITEAAH